MILKRLSHPNLVTLLEIVISKSRPESQESIAEGKKSVFLVFEYMEHDLLGLISRKVKFGLPQIKFIVKELLQGLNTLHAEGIIHRDIKCRSLLSSRKHLGQQKGRSQSRRFWAWP